MSGETLTLLESKPKTVSLVEAAQRAGVDVSPIRFEDSDKLFIDFDWVKVSEDGNHLLGLGGLDYSRVLLKDGREILDFLHGVDEVEIPKATADFSRFLVVATSMNRKFSSVYFINEDREACPLLTEQERLTLLDCDEGLSRFSFSSVYNEPDYSRQWKKDEIVIIGGKMTKSVSSFKMIDGGLSGRREMEEIIKISPNNT